MLFESFKEPLAQFGVSPSAIAKVYVLKMGGVLFSRFPEIDLSSDYPIEELEKRENSVKSSDQGTDPFHKLHDQLIKALKKHPNVFEVKSLEFDKDLSMSTSSRIGELHIVRPLRAQIKLPSRLQKYHRDFTNLPRPIEQFSVITSGSIFIAYAPVQVYPAWPNIGHEYREMLRQHINAETSIRIPHFGPTPIHPNIYLIIRTTAPKVASQPFQVFSKDEDIFIVLAQTTLKQHADFVQYILTSCQFTQVEFYRLLANRSIAQLYFSEILNRFRDLSASVESIHSTAWWRMIARNGAAHRGRRAIAQIQSGIVASEIETLDAEKQSTQVHEQVEGNIFLSTIKQYFHTECQADVTVPHSLSQALAHFASELQLFGNIQSLAVFTLLGAIIGAIIAGLLS